MCGFKKQRAAKSSTTPYSWKSLKFLKDEGLLAIVTHLRMFMLMTHTAKGFQFVKQSKSTIKVKHSIYTKKNSLLCFLGALQERCANVLTNL